MLQGAGASCSAVLTPASLRRSLATSVIPPVLLFLLLLQLLVGFGGLGGGSSTSRGGGRGGGGWWEEAMEEEEGGGGGRRMISFSVISIEPERSLAPPPPPPSLRHRHRGGPVSSSSSSGPPDRLDDDDDDVDEDGGDGVERRRGGEEEESVARRGYDDENETPTARQGRGQGVELQPWAAGGPSFDTELERLIGYMTTPQVNCSRVLVPGQSQASQQASGLRVLVPGQSQASGLRVQVPVESQASGPRVEVPSESQASQAPGGPSEAWLLCAEDWLLPTAHSPCVAYSFSMDEGDADFLQTVLGRGCQVHRFDPGTGRSSKAASSSSNHSGRAVTGVSADGEGGVVTRHRMWLEWRAAPRTRKRPRRRGRGGGGGASLGSVSHTLADIMEALGHHTVDFLYADLLSAEWRVFQNWLELGTVDGVRHLVARVHLQWAGFEVPGATDSEVLRYWFSVLRGLGAAGLRLVHSAPTEGAGGHEDSVLKRATEGTAHGGYTLSWVNVT